MRQYIAVVVTGALLNGCASQRTFFWYEPEANWGKDSYRVGCPIHTPARALTQQAFPYLSIHVSILDDINARNRRIQDPTLIFDLGKRASPIELITQSYKKREATEVRVKASSPTVDVRLEDGSHRQFAVPDFREELTFVGEHRGKTILVSLTGLRPQTFTVSIPDFEVNGEVLTAGPIRFVYKQTTRSIC
jgi:hypothetical protein